MNIETVTARKLGALSERYESGGRGPGTVSGGRGDPGGVSYGTYQLASRTGTVEAFMASEGKRWSAELSAAPGSAGFSAAWKAIAAREGKVFGEAQHAFIERTHYRPVIKAVEASSGYDLDERAQALRDAVWSTAVQHGSAVRIVSAALADADAAAPRATPEHDRALIEAIYERRSRHVLSLAARSVPAVQRTLTNVALRRYPQERAEALAMLA